MLFDLADCEYSAVIPAKAGMHQSASRDADKGVAAFAGTAV
jgi:hypothetical protein